MAKLSDYEVYVNNYVAPHRTHGQVLPVAIMAMFIAIPVVAIVMPFTDLLGVGKAVQLNVRNLALAVPGIMLLTWFLIVYWAVHYGGRAEANQPPHGPVTVDANDYKR